MRTLRDMNLSKFVAEDVPLFLSLIEDLFPGLKAAPMKHAAVESSLQKAIPELNLQPLESWVLKVIQTYEMSLVRHSLMLVGPSGTGKSKIVETLHKTLEACTETDAEPPMVGQSHKEVRMNPKAILAPQMFGTRSRTPTWLLCSAPPLLPLCSPCPRHAAVLLCRRRHGPRCSPPSHAALVRRLPLDVT